MLRSDSVGRSYSVGVTVRRRVLDGPKKQKKAGVEDRACTAHSRAHTSCCHLLHVEGELGHRLR